MSEFALTKLLERAQKARWDSWRENQGLEKRKRELKGVIFSKDYKIDALIAERDELKKQNAELTLLAEARAVNAGFYRGLRKKLDKRVTELWDENQELKADRKELLETLVVISGRLLIAENVKMKTEDTFGV